jgi:ribosomal protein S18 acetylase RimI-like enzyme
MVQAAGLNRFSMRKMNYEHEDIRFAFDLRNANAANFFYSKPLEWLDHVVWCTEVRDNERGDFDFYILEVTGKRAGTIGVEHRQDCEFLQNLCVHEWARGQGLAKWAICQLMKPGRFIIAQVKPSNKHVIKMYEELGFWRVP